jgi:hypothetical protein
MQFIYFSLTAFPQSQLSQRSDQGCLAALSDGIELVEFDKKIESSAKIPLTLKRPTTDNNKTDHLLATVFRRISYSFPHLCRLRELFPQPAPGASRVGRATILRV